MGPLVSSPPGALASLGKFETKLAQSFIAMVWSIAVTINPLPCLSISTSRATRASQITKVNSRSREFKRSDLRIAKRMLLQFTTTPFTSTYLVIHRSFISRAMPVSCRMATCSVLELIRSSCRSQAEQHESCTSLACISLELHSLSRYSAFYRIFFTPVILHLNRLL